MSFLQMSDLDLAGKRVLIRVDLNVPMKDGQVANDERIVRVLPTIKQAIAGGAQVMLLSHFGRPTPGEWSEDASLAPVCAVLADLLQQPVQLISDPLHEPLPADVSVMLFENTRFWVGETENDDALAKQLAGLADIFVMDAFATAHRRHASTYGVAEYAPIACAGPLLAAELAAMESALTQPQRPLAAIVGGAKVSTKMRLIERLLDRVDVLIVGGGIANTFLLAQGHEVGTSLVEPDFVDYAKKCLEYAASKGVQMPLPIDVVVAPAMNQPAAAQIRPIAEVGADEAIFDVGPETRALYGPLLAKMMTILWNGPVGLFEEPAFSLGTQAMAEAVAASPAYSLAGGGDTLAAIDHFELREKISYISTGGGAFLTWCEGATLPAVEILTKRARDK